MNANSPRKVVLIGIDSATLHVAQPLMDSGRMPNLRRLLSEGSGGVLHSIVPPVTPEAWTSMLTGVNPGKHGIFDFFAPPVASYDRPTVNATYNRAAPVWKQLSDAGRRVGLINVPLTCPAVPVNGFLIPGLQTTRAPDGEFAHPPGLLRELESVIGAKYEVVYGDAAAHYLDKPEGLLRRWREINERRIKAILHLMDHHPTDFFMPVFYSIDAIQHAFWKHYDTNHPLHDPARRERYGGIIPEFYARIDQAIGSILERCDANTVVMVASDHGAGPLERAFHLNHWLLQRGYLHLQPKYRWLVDHRWDHLLYKILHKFGSPAVENVIPIKGYPLLRNRVDPREGLRLSRIIDWSRTRAFAGTYTEQGIYVNLKGRQSQGIVEPGPAYEQVCADLARDLMEIREPGKTEPFVQKVWRREQVYNGPYTAQAADLFIEVGHGRCLMLPQVYGGLWHPARRLSGTHMENGLVAVWGPGVRRGHRGEWSLMDIAPTVLYFMGAPIPTGLDGRLMQDLIEPALLAAQPPRIADPTPASAASSIRPVSEDENRQLSAVLQDLGYL